MLPKTTLWPMSPHTEGKHLVLRRYLDAWLPILGSRFGRILFIDGFAGPGAYVGGEEGSPLVALRALAEHTARGMITAETVFVFIEKDLKRAHHLRGLISDLPFKLPRNCTIEVISGAFDETLTEVLDHVEAQKSGLAPSFVMVDPFGVSDTPMSVIRRLLANRRSKVYITFMYDAISRFSNTPEFAPHLDGLFGCDSWREGIDIEDSRESKRFYYDLYEAQLKAAGAENVVRFELYEGKRLVYAVLFGTQHWMGADRMKQAIWRVCSFGDFAFRGTRSPQGSLLLSAPDYGALQDALRREFCGKGWVSVASLEEFVGSDRTDFHCGHLKKNGLKPMEESGALEADNETRKKRYTYPEGTLVRFL